ncbi:Uu.00g039740.m01.CDS01 [Anthostomella pinea]|uniref:protein-ribulosamine 3-kinase n=1 Tax=Anthostomella pinea TaxID=933095 RepID=A0AAI8YDS2_9PEZI|nr:Uu.00g039740.m01.CDS01 [Anthostomella pinea]
MAAREETQSQVSAVPAPEVADLGAPFSIKEVLARLNGVFPMDEAVIEALPAGATFVSVEHFGFSAFTITGRLVARQKDGTETLCFLKVAYNEHGRIMLYGEWESSRYIHGIMPDFIPTPLGFGKYKAKGPATYFYLSDFVDMDVTTAPDPMEFTTRLANMHQISRSPTGKFGFHITTCDGKMAHTVEWQDSWAEFYKKLLLGVCEVIPRLLGVLQENGRQIKPSIIHGDLWEGNMGINMETGNTLLFDAGSYFAYNEMELGHWRCEFSSHFRSPLYTRHYVENFTAAEPPEEFDDRNRLYSIKGAINYSAGHPGSQLRKTAYNNMVYLCEKYASCDGIDASPDVNEVFNI